ncbi:DinB family protein [Zobellia barbeyronii]|uniref:Damage-inducible protein DinB n=1 Tax=Zobellia barbeyronii TaxID=2748009 RepID=A0ABS5WGT4_9FLAO|nr:DinB family protein [Zobellia barbeyronii]MBT2162621.1 damage-inducible protein DinB [Zobellia barbeyronii]
MSTAISPNEQVAQVILPAELLAHWQGHRTLTRKVIEAFPEKDFFEYSIGGMRPFSKMVDELLSIAGPGIQEIVTGQQAAFTEEVYHGNSKSKVLELWDETTEKIYANWTKIGVDKFHEIIKLFGQYEGTVQSAILYFIDNEIHHRGQGYVYLRSLGIEPPMFWERNEL